MKKTDIADETKGERIAKVIARAGVASRRDAEKLVEAGKVTVNGTRVTHPATHVTDDDRIVVNGTALPKKEVTRLWIYHKPSGLVTTHRDEQGRETVFDALPKTLPRVISVGRLDLTTEGLLLLTNDGHLARHLELPATGWKRRYRARVYGLTNPDMLLPLKKGITIEDTHYGAIDAVVEKDGMKSNCWVSITLSEGKNREIRKVFEHIGCTVNRLIRVAYGPFQLGSLEKGEVREVTGKVLKEQLGAFISAKK